MEPFQYAIWIKDQPSTLATGTVLADDAEQARLLAVEQGCPTRAGDAVSVRDLEVRVKPF